MAISNLYKRKIEAVTADPASGSGVTKSLPSSNTTTSAKKLPVSRATPGNGKTVENIVPVQQDEGSEKRSLPSSNTTTNAKKLPVSRATPGGGKMVENIVPVQPDDGALSKSASASGSGQAQGNTPSARPAARGSGSGASVSGTLPSYGQSAPAPQASVSDVLQALSPLSPLAPLQTQMPEASGGGYGDRYEALESVDPGNGYLTDYDPGEFTLSDYAEQYRDRLADLEAEKPDPFQSRYREDIDGILDTLLSRPDFNADSVYDSDLYKNYRDQYMLQGSRAMRDAQGSAAGLTGGYGSSYGLAAGQQAYDNYLSQLNDRSLDIYDRMYQEYLNEGQELYNQLGALNNQDAVDYGRYRDDMADYQWGLGYLSDRYEQTRADDYAQYQSDVARQQWAEEYAYQRAQDALAQQNWEKELAYRQSQDALSQQNWEKQWAYQQSQDALAQQNWEKELAYQQSQDALSQQNWEKQWEYQQLQDALSQQNWEKQWAYQQSQDAQSQRNWAEEFAYQKSQDALAQQNLEKEYAAQAQAKAQEQASGRGPDEYGSIVRTVVQLPSNKQRFEYLYNISASDEELEEWCRLLNVTPVEEDEEDVMDPAARRLSILTGTTSRVGR